MSFCIKCGKQIGDSFVFCPQCGQRQPQQANQSVDTQRNVGQNLHEVVKPIEKNICPSCGAGVKSYATICKCGARLKDSYSHVFHKEGMGVEAFGESINEFLEGWDDIANVKMAMNNELHIQITFDRLCGKNVFQYGFKGIKSTNITGKNTEALVQRFRNENPNVIVCDYSGRKRAVGDIGCLLFLNGFGALNFTSAYILYKQKR